MTCVPYSSMDVISSSCVIAGSPTLRSNRVASRARRFAAMTEVWATDVDTVTFHDPLAAVCVLEPDVCTWRGGRVSVELTSRRFRGATSFDVDEHGSPHLVADTVEPAHFFDVLFGAW